MKTLNYNLTMTLQKNSLTFRAHFLTADSTVHNPLEFDVMQFGMFVAVKAAH
jgi:hypothetical protein